MLIDLHIHEKTHSSDSQLDLKKAVQTAKKKGLHAIGITDHDSMGIYQTAERISREMDFPVFVGVEVATYEGDLLVYGVDSVPEQLMHAQELIDWAEDRGGISIAAHPYRKNGRSLEDKMFELKGLAGIEVLNGNTPTDLNNRAMQTAIDLNLPLLGSSDAHHADRIGKFATRFYREILTVKDLVREIRLGNTAPVHYDQGAYHVLNSARVKEIAV